MILRADCYSTRAGDIKKVCETEIGVLSQCVLSKHVGKCQAQYLSNVALKINLKVKPRARAAPVERELQSHRAFCRAPASFQSA